MGNNGGDLIISIIWLLAVSLWGIDISSVLVTYGICREKTGFYVISHSLASHKNYDCTKLSLQRDFIEGLFLQNLAATSKRMVILLQLDLLWLFFKEMDKEKVHGLKVYLVWISERDLLKYRHEFPNLLIKRYYHESLLSYDKLDLSFFNFTHIQKSR